MRDSMEALTSKAKAGPSKTSSGRQSAKRKRGGGWSSFEDLNDEMLKQMGGAMMFSNAKTAGAGPSNVGTGGGALNISGGILPGPVGINPASFSASNAGQINHSADPRIRPNFPEGHTYPWMNGMIPFQPQATMHAVPIYQNASHPPSGFMHPYMPGSSLQQPQACDPTQTQLRQSGDKTISTSGTGEGTGSETSAASRESTEVTNNSDKMEHSRNGAEAGNGASTAVSPRGQRAHSKMGSPVQTQQQQGNEDTGSKKSHGSRTGKKDRVTHNSNGKRRRSGEASASSSKDGPRSSPSAADSGSHPVPRASGSHTAGGNDQANQAQTQAQAQIGYTHFGMTYPLPHASPGAAAGLSYIPNTNTATTVSQLRQQVVQLSSQLHAAHAHIQGLQAKLSFANMMLQQSNIASTAPNAEVSSFSGADPDKGVPATGEVAAFPPMGQTRYWSTAEHAKFLEAIDRYGPKNMKAISEYVGTRTPTQVRTHAQKYLLRMSRLKDAKEAKGLDMLAPASPLGIGPASASASGSGPEACSRLENVAVGGEGNAVLSGQQVGSSTGSGSGSSGSTGSDTGVANDGGSNGSGAPESAGEAPPVTGDDSKASNSV